LVTRQMGAGSSAWLERSTDNRKVGSSNPPRPTINPTLLATKTELFLLDNTKMLMNTILFNRILKLL
jgi:hypothetical protein